MRHARAKIVQIIDWQFSWADDAHAKAKRHWSSFWNSYVFEKQPFIEGILHVKGHVPLYFYFLLERYCWRDSKKNISPCILCMLWKLLEIAFRWIPRWKTIEFSYVQHITDKKIVYAFLRYEKL